MLKDANNFGKKKGNCIFLGSAFVRDVPFYGLHRTCTSEEVKLLGKQVFTFVLVSFVLYFEQFGILRSWNVFRVECYCREEYIYYFVHRENRKE